MLPMQPHWIALNNWHSSSIFILNFKIQPAAHAISYTNLNYFIQFSNYTLDYWCRKIIILMTFRKRTSQFYFLRRLHHFFTALLSCQSMYLMKQNCFLPVLSFKVFSDSILLNKVSDWICKKYMLWSPWPSSEIKMESILKSKVESSIL